jgi:hypothetical protein
MSDDPLQRAYEAGALARYALTFGRSLRSYWQRRGCVEHDPLMGRSDAHRQRETASPWEAVGSEISEDGLWWRSPTRPAWTRMPYVDQYGNAWDGVTWIKGKRPASEWHRDAAPAQPNASLPTAGRVVPDRGDRKLERCVLLSQWGTSLVPKSPCWMASDDTAIYAGSGQTVSGTPSVTIPYKEIRDLEVTGSVTRGGGRFFGGGFGVQGAVEGIAAATVLNALTSRTKAVTTIRLSADSVEIVLQLRGAAPDDVRTLLAPVFRRIDMARPARDRTSDF